MISKRTTYFRYDGFTLLELILVLIIISTVLGLAAPNLRGFFSSQQLTDLGEQIVVLTRYARMKAVQDSTYYRINFNLSERRYWLEMLEDSQYRPIERDFTTDYILGSDVTVEFENIEMDGSIYYIEFAPEGYSKQCRIRLEDTKGNIVEVVCYGPAEQFELIELIDGKEDERE